ncbi:MAG: PocR ligand-binding domain-containing protein [Candidatus Ozemobacteraceae bacterium]
MKKQKSLSPITEDAEIEQLRKKISSLTNELDALKREKAECRPPLKPFTAAPCTKISDIPDSAGKPTPFLTLSGDSLQPGNISTAGNAPPSADFFLGQLISQPQEIFPPVFSEPARLEEVIDVHSLQALMDDFYRLTKIGVAIVDVSGKILVATGWEDICTNFHRVHPITRRACIESNTALMRGVQPGRCKSHKCPNGMRDLATPIFIGQAIVGSIFFGQFFYDDEEVDPEHFRNQARQYEFDEKAYMEALSRVPRRSHETVDTAMRFYIRLAHMISLLGFTNSQLSQSVHDQERLLGSYQESANLLSSILDSVPQSIFWKDRNSVYLGCNEVFAKRVGLHSPKEVVGKSDFDFDFDFTAEESKAYRTDDQEVLSTGLPKTHIIEPLRQADGSIRWADTTKIPLKNAEGNIYGVLGMYQDITEQKSVTEALKESEERLRTLINAMPDIVCFKDGEGRWLEANDFDLRLFGLEHVAYRGKKGSDLASFSPFYREIFRVCEESDDVAWRHGEPSRADETIPCPDGSTLVFDIIKVPTFHKDGKRKGLVIIGRDITKRKHAEEERLAMERRLLHSQKLESMGILAGGIAHDFNNLLLVMVGNLDLAMVKLDTPNLPLSELSQVPIASAKIRIKQAMQAAYRASDLTRQMLAYSGKGLFSIKKLHLNHLVEENIHLFRTVISKNITFQFQPDTNLPMISADASQMQQIIMNLLTNASEAIGEAPGSINLYTGAVTVSAEELVRSKLEEKPQPGRFVCLEVRDSGCGMSIDTQHRMFDPFFTTKFTGRGLGLSAVLGIVRGHKGAIFLDSNVGGGTSIRVLFPLMGMFQETSAQEADARPKHTQAAGTQTTDTQNESAPKTDTPVKTAAAASLQSSLAFGHGTILLADDEEMVREICREMLVCFGFTVLVANDGREAVDLFKKHASEVSCTILDLSMPNLDGLGAFEEIRELRKEACVILSSGFSEIDAIHRFAGKGLNGFLQKPFTIQILEDELKQVFRAAGEIT